MIKKIELKNTSHKIQLNVGCGIMTLSNYINIDMNYMGADILMDARKLGFIDNSIDKIVAYHLLEHLEYDDVISTLMDWYRILKPNGILDIELPDIMGVCKRYISEKSMDKRYNILSTMYGLKDLTHHLSGWDKEILWHHLNLVGYVDIIQTELTREDITYGPNMRFNCRKPFDNTILSKLDNPYSKNV